ncbi:MAG: enoyl-[acyl-carrier-protein] reductase FabK [Chloroflexi bacterium]|jgi:enoyl-[acyl-carrier protein] reductase II|nr:enoyl-[acyl-carrier-protein] reductase FabK [Chloroflexota bacterium]
MLVTPLTKMLGIRHPILQGGMAWVATWELVVAVSEGGGLGILGAGSAPTDVVARQLAAIRAHSGKSFGVNVPLFNPEAADIITLCAAERVPVVTTGAGNPAPHIAPLKDAGVIVIPVVASAALARRLERAGADAVIAEGLEAGGHIGTVSTMALVPQVVDAVTIPVIAAGGLGDGRGLAAALALGAAGIQMGTRFICTDECIAHAQYKQAIVNANERSTMVTGATLGHPVRCLRNPMAHEFEELERRGASEQEILDFGTGRLRRAVMDGDVTHGSVMAGQIAGLIHEVLPAAEVLRRTIAQAEEILARLPTTIVS